MVTHPGPNELVSLDMADGVAEIRLCRPERRNCLSLAMFEDLYATFKSVDDSLSTVTAIALTHEGPVLSSGLDMDVMGDPDRESEQQEIRRYYKRCFEWYRTVPRPVLVGAKGPAVASGGGLLLRSDINVVSEEFEIWFPEINVGVFSWNIGPRFIKYLGPHRAAEIVFLGDDARLDAQESREIGFVNRIVPAAAVDETVRELARSLADLEAEHEYLVPAYEVFNVAKLEHQSMDTGAQVLSESRAAHDQWFGPGLITDQDE